MWTKGVELADVFLITLETAFLAVGKELALLIELVHLFSLFVKRRVGFVEFFAHLRVFDLECAVPLFVCRELLLVMFGTLGLRVDESLDADEDANLELIKEIDMTSVIENASLICSLYISTSVLRMFSNAW